MKFIKQTVFFVFFLILLINTNLISKAYSQTSIGVIDVMTLLQKAKASVSMKEQLNNVAKGYTEQEKKKSKEIQQKEEELLRQKKTLTPEAFSDRKNAFEKVVIEFNKDRDKKRKALAKAEREAVTKIEEAVEKIVTEMIKNENMSVVLRKSAVILSDPAIDITDKVIEKLDSELTKIDVKVTP